MSTSTVDRLMDVVRQLPEHKANEVLDFAQFLLWQSGAVLDETAAIEVWAQRHAHTKSFAGLSEEDVAYIVHKTRQETE